MKHVEIKKVLFFGVKAVHPKQHLDRGEQILWTVPHADTGTKAILFFPDAAAVFGTPVSQEFDPIGGITLTATAEAPSGEHVYTVFCVIDGEEHLAEGASPPEVIIN